MPMQMRDGDLDASAVVDFIDSVVSPNAPPSLLPEDAALMLASSAASLVAVAPADRARAQLLAGRVMLHK